MDLTVSNEETKPKLDKIYKWVWNCYTKKCILQPAKLMLNDTVVLPEAVHEVETTLILGKHG